MSPAGLLCFVVVDASGASRPYGQIGVCLAKTSLKRERERRC